MISWLISSKQSMVGILAAILGGVIYFLGKMSGKNKTLKEGLATHDRINKADTGDGTADTARKLLSQRKR